MQENFLYRSLSPLSHYNSLDERRKHFHNFVNDRLQEHKLLQQLQLDHSHQEFISRIDRLRRQRDQLGKQKLLANLSNSQNHIDSLSDQIEKKLNPIYHFPKFLPKQQKEKQFKKQECNFFNIKNESLWQEQNERWFSQLQKKMSQVRSKIINRKQRSEKEEQQLFQIQENISKRKQLEKKKKQLCQKEQKRTINNQDIYEKMKEKYWLQMQQKIRKSQVEQNQKQQLHQKQSISNNQFQNQILNKMMKQKQMQNEIVRRIENDKKNKISKQRRRDYSLQQIPVENQKVNFKIEDVKVRQISFGKQKKEQKMLEPLTTKKQLKCAMNKIKNRVELSKMIFEDSEHRTIQHEKEHLANKFEAELKGRRGVIQKICGSRYVAKKYHLILV